MQSGGGHIQYAFCCARLSHKTLGHTRTHIKDAADGWYLPNNKIFAGSAYLMGRTPNTSTTYMHVLEHHFYTFLKYTFFKRNFKRRNAI